MTDKLSTETEGITKQFCNDECYGWEATAYCKLPYGHSGVHNDGDGVSWFNVEGKSMSTEAGTAGMRDKFETWIQGKGLSEMRGGCWAAWQAASLTQAKKEEIARRVAAEWCGPDSKRYGEKLAAKQVLAIINEVLSQ